MLRKFGMATLAAATIAGSTVAMTGTADAQRRHYHGHHHHGGGGGAWVAPAIVGGLALGALAASAGPRCWMEDRVYVDGRGREFIRPVRICN